MNLVAVILAGGAGTRLYPLSSEDRPKQFVPLFGGRSLIQMTWSRMLPLLPPDRIFVSTNERYEAQVKEHLPEIPAANILTEPARRNTGPATALCMSLVADRVPGDPVVSFVHSDHFMANEDQFRKTLGTAVSFASDFPFLVTVGIRPTEPDTGFGYMEVDEELRDDVYRVKRFTEKPSLELAKEFVESGRFLWNAGLFNWRVSTFRHEMERSTPELLEVTTANYAGAPSIAIDVALMEKSQNVATTPGDFGWSDVGTFAALRKAGADIPEGL